MRTGFARVAVGLMERVCYLPPVEAGLMLENRTRVIVVEENRKLHGNSLVKLMWKKKTVVTG